MANTSKKELSPKHWKALQLIEEGRIPLKDIAAACGWSKEYFYKLYEGNIERCGGAAALFDAELRKLTERHATKVRQLVKENKKLALEKLNERLRVLKDTKVTTEVTNEITKILNALSKTVPSVEINSLSIHKGLTDKELINEFTRLRAIAQHALEGRGVSRTFTDGSRILFESTGEGHSISEESKDTILPSTQEARDLSQK